MKTIVATTLLALIFFKNTIAAPFDMVTPQTKVCIVYAADDHKLDSIAARLLAEDIQRVSGYLPTVYSNIAQAKGNVIIIGSIYSDLIKRLTNKSIQQLEGKWECYRLQTIKNLNASIRQALVVAGSDARGTAFGVFDISQRIGVSPWYWWADVTPQVQKQLSLNIGDFTSAPPSVKYRGIFINDEDWGLQPWAAKTFEPETGDIGPKTYAKIFELLLRLKANFIWPAMHPSTKAFYSYPGNKQVAADYEIVVGSSHAEPMLRNNVSEWNEKTMGPFNYLTNKAKVYDYWESRVKESRANNVIYSMGMRGVHDSPIEGAKTPKEAVPLLEQIFTDQRGLFQKYINPDATKVPQVFTVYKEVLDIYAAGLQVPDDVTLMWPDDNYGYIQRLSNSQEAKRAGGAGVYYHASYWGRPHDYLWLSTTHPALMREEMTKAYALNAKNIWVLNVGDIKPAEYNIQLFMDMAYRIDSFNNPGYSAVHLQNWVADAFGKNAAPAIAKMVEKYYDLAFERKPEFMGWSQTEPTTPTHFTAYNHTYFADQAQQRIDSYDAIETAAKTIGASIPANRKDAFFELVQYPVMGASLMNKKFLYHDKAFLYAKQGRLSASQYAALSQQAYNDIVSQTAYYNTQLAGGKWNRIMPMAPRNLPAYQAPDTNLVITNSRYNWMALPEGYPQTDSTVSQLGSSSLALPSFNQGNQQSYFVDVFLCKKEPVDFTIEPSANWIKVSEQQGRLLPQGLQSQQRLWVSIDWSKIPREQALAGSIVIKSGNTQFTITVAANRLYKAELQQYKGVVESGGYIAIPATAYSRISSTPSRSWKPIDGLGSAGKALEAWPLYFDASANPTDTQGLRNQPRVEYDFFSFTATDATLSIYTLPTLPLNPAFEMRYAVQLDDGPVTIQNFKTAGRTEEWKQNVLSNAAVRKIRLPNLPSGKHKLTIYQIDPGVILDRIFIDLGANQPFYGKVPETVKP